MSVYAGPNIIEDGLILCIDPANSKSYDSRENLCPVNSVPDATYDIEDTVVLSPDGNPSRRFYEGATDLSYALARTFSSTVSVKAGNRYNYSCYFKEGDSGRSIRLQWDGATTSFGNSLVASFYPSSKTLGNFGGVTSGYQELDNGWYRVWFVTPVATVDSSTITPRIYMLNTTLNQLTNAYDDSTNLFYYYYGPQITTGEELKPYVRTTGTEIALSNTINDMSKNNAVGTITSEPIYTISNKGGLIFDGVSDFIDFGNNAIFNVGNNITVNIWFYVNSISSYQTLVAKVTSDYSLGWEIANSSGIFRTTLRPSATQINLAQGTLATGNWYMGTMTFDDTTVKLYLNGVETGSTSAGGPVTLNSTENLTIGRRAAGNYHDGNISQVMIYNRALSATEIQQNFNANRSRFGL